MRDTRAQRDLQSMEIAVEIAGKEPFEITRDILKAMCQYPDARVGVHVQGEKYFTLAVDGLSSREEYGLVYRMFIEPGREEQVESFAGKEYRESRGRGHSRPCIRGTDRLVGSCSRHSIGKHKVILPFLGEIHVARRSMVTGPPNPFAAQIFCDHGDMPAFCSRWQHGEYATSISLGLNKEINEDGVMCRLLPESPKRGASLLGVVADGMGGEVGGQAAVLSILSSFATADFSEFGLTEAAATLPYHLKHLYRDVLQRPEQGVTTLVGPNMGAPFAAVRIFDDKFEALRAGDCRIAHYSPTSSGYSCVWSSKDQGIGSMVDNPVCLVRGEPSALELRPEFHQLAHDDYVVVATDGVWKRLTLDMVGRILTQTSSAETAEGDILESIVLSEIETDASDNRGLIVYRHGVQEPRGNLRKD
jgi:serine/threonine protein phosphatase PrpC